VVVKYFLNESKLWDYPFAHSRPDKIGTPRLLPLDISDIFFDYQQKNPLKDNPTAF
jgi:hypothetical protein